MINPAAQAAVGGDGGSQPMTNGEARDGNARRRAPLDVKDPAEVVTTDRQFFSAWTNNVKVIGNIQLAGCQRDSPPELGKGNLVGTRGSVGVDNCLAQRTHATVTCVADRKVGSGYGIRSAHSYERDHNDGY